MTSVIHIDDKQITIYGEEHNNIEDNSIYEHIVDEHFKDSYVLVEHSILLCNLPEEEQHLFEDSKGSEYIWSRAKMNDYINISCIDERLVLGFLPAYIEHNILFKYEDMTKTFLLKILNQIKVVITSDVLQEHMNFIDTYTQYLIIHKQLMLKNIQICKLCIQQDTDISNFRELSYDDVFKITIKSLVNDFKILGSLSVDISILKKINILEEPKFLVFTGMNHLIRLSKLYDGDLEVEDKFIELSNPYPTSTDEHVLDEIIDSFSISIQKGGDEEEIYDEEMYNILNDITEVYFNDTVQTGGVCSRIKTIRKSCGYLEGEPIFETFKQWYVRTKKHNHHLKILLEKYLLLEIFRKYVL